MTNQLTSNEREERLAGIRNRFGTSPATWEDIGFLLSLLDSQAAGVTPHGEMTPAEEVLWRREREGQMLKSMAAQGRWIESLQTQLNHAATAMRTACVEKVKDWLGKARFDYRPLVKELESIPVKSNGK